LEKLFIIIIIIIIIKCIYIAQNRVMQLMRFLKNENALLKTVHAQKTWKIQKLHGLFINQHLHSSSLHLYPSIMYYLFSGCTNNFCFSSCKMPSKSCNK